MPRGDVTLSARLKVLELIEQGKLSPEEGARLLQAMTPPAEPRSSAKRSPTQPPTDLGGWGRWAGRGRADQGPARRLHWAARKLDLHDLREGLRDLGKEIREGIRPAVESIVGPDALNLSGFEEFGGEAIALPEGPLPGLKVRCAGGDVRIVRAAGREIRVGGDAETRIFTSALGAAGGEVVIRAREGDLEVETPSGLAFLDVRNDGGDSSIDLDVQRLVVATAGGDASFHGVAGQVSASAAGGDLRLESLRLTGGESKVSSAGGDLQVILTADSNVAISAKTVGGSVNLPGGLRGRSRQAGPVAKAEALVGAGTASLRLSSAGGDVTVEVES